jgi:predicted O-methyltransferase YrrM
MTGGLVFVRYCVPLWSQTMIGNNESAAPPAWREIQARSRALGFDMPSDVQAGSLLKLLIASKPGGRFLELGTGTGLATAWMLDGMDEASTLVTVDVERRYQEIARSVLGDDPRVSFVLQDGLDFILRQTAGSYDLVFADAMPGKYDGLADAMALVRRGGFYVGDDMLPQPNWPEGHQQRVDSLITTFGSAPGWTVTTLAWGTGFVLAVRV